MSGDKGKVAAALIVSGACLLLASLHLDQSSSLYATTAVKPMTPVAGQLIRRTVTNRLHPAQVAVSGNQAPEQVLNSAHGHGQSWLGAAALAFTAGVTALFLNFFRKPSTSSDPLGLEKYQAAEARWSMAAATAFIGTKAPDFKATAVFDEEFVEINLSQYRGKKYVVLFFYPLDFTFVCPTEITAFSDREAEFSAIDTQIIGVSVDSQFSHLAWVQTPRNEGGLGEITYPLVADLKKEIAEAYGVLTEDGVALRGLFIIDKEGIIQHATINNLAFGRNVDETLRVLEAVQHVQANPDEVCPAGWKKGDKTMKPDPEGSKEYFQAI